MKSQVPSVPLPARLSRIVDGLIVHQALYVAAKLGVADRLSAGPQTVAELADQLEVNESALYRILRALASQGVFEETNPEVFANTELSQFLYTGVPGSIRSVLILRGSEFFYAPFGEILYSVQTGKSARARMHGMGGFEYLKTHPELARVFDDAMTDISKLAGPAVAAAYDFGAWGSVMDIGGGNGMLLAAVLNAHPQLHGVLADLPHVLERARQRGFLADELEARSAFEVCDFFREVPSGCRAYMLKSVIHDWDDEASLTILTEVRREVEEMGNFEG
jgi:C-methyltransferase